MENDTITSDNKEVAEKLNNFVIEAVENLEIETFYPDIVYAENINEIIKNYKTHPNYKKLQDTPQHFKDKRKDERGK